ncbi:MAG: RsmE family RNA methyltransferase [Actinomycetota bacterium]|nr:RsmE family RNA methyltransferase [Actinomycetota bacterium]MDA8294339.1 RsmE family RNA methyltransferase [Actinomycetota bacterium]
MTGPGPGAEAAPAAPDPLLSGASAMVFVADPEHPTLADDEAHHLFDVLRLQPGEPVVAADGAGRWVPCRVEAHARSASSGRDRDGLVLEPVGPLRCQPARRPSVAVAFAPTKGDRPEWAVQKLTELGVDVIVPLRTARSVVRWEGERGRRSVERLRRVATEAAAQCRRPRLPMVTEVATLDEVAVLAGAPPVLAEPGGPPPDLGHTVVAIGPEGGWAPGELDLPYGRVGLGPTVLRAETAAVAAGTLLGALRSGSVAAAYPV